MRIAHRDGWSYGDIAEHFGFSKTVVFRFLNRPLPPRPEEVEILLPVNVLLPGEDEERCPHGEIVKGDRVYCVRCHKTGIENHPKLEKPRPKPKKESKHKFQPRGKNKAKKAKA